jgi:hypothetical protein
MHFQIDCFSFNPVHFVGVILASRKTPRRSHAVNAANNCFVKTRLHWMRPSSFEKRLLIVKNWIFYQSVLLGNNLYGGKSVRVDVGE